MYALSIKYSLVYVRLWTRNDKFKAEAIIKHFKTRNPNYQLFTNRPNIEKFHSDLRESRDEMKEHIFQKYVNILNIKGLGQYIPKFEAFKRAIFLDDKYAFEKGVIKVWVEFTDPTNRNGLLLYTFGNDPFAHMEWENPIPNPRFSYALHQALSGITGCSQQ